MKDFQINFSRSRRQVEPALGDTAGERIIFVVDFLVVKN